MGKKEKKKPQHEAIETVEDSVAAPIEEVYKHADKMSMKQQILTHLEDISNVVAYAILTEKDGRHTLVSSLPQEINDLMALWQTGAVSKYQKGIISMVVLEAKERLIAYQKMLEEQSPSEADAYQKMLEEQAKPKLITP